MLYDSTNQFSDPKRPAGGRTGYTPAELGNDYSMREECLSGSRGV